MPYFDPKLPGLVAFTVGESWQLTLPEYKDDDGEKVTMTVNTNGIRFLRYSRSSRTLSVAAGSTRESDIKIHPMYISLKDTYDLGQNENLITLSIWVQPIALPYYILRPTNRRPMFGWDLPTDAVSFNITEAWEYLMPSVYDFDRDDAVVSVVGEGTPYVKVATEPLRLFIDANTTTEAQIGPVDVQLAITDIPVDLAPPLTSYYTFPVIGVDESLYERYARLQPWSNQEGPLPSASFSINE